MGLPRFFDIFRRSAGAGPAHFLVFGIGNPGSRYAATRHNVGYMVADSLIERMGKHTDARTCKADVTTGEWEGTAVAAAKPLTYVNRSGEAFELLVRRLAIPLDRCIVVTDDLNIPLGALRLRRGGSDGGHNGLKSIIDQVGSDFPRLRIGIGPVPRDMSVIDFVLGEFAPEAGPVVREVIRRAVEGVGVFVREGIDAAMNDFNRKQTGKFDTAVGSSL